MEKEELKQSIIDRTEFLLKDLSRIARVEPKEKEHWAHCRYCGLVRGHEPTCPIHEISELLGDIDKLAWK